MIPHIQKNVDSIEEFSIEKINPDSVILKNNENQVKLLLGKEVPFNETII